MDYALQILDAARQEPGGIEGLNFDQRIAMAQVWATLANAEAISALTTAVQDVAVQDVNGGIRTAQR